MTPARDNSRHDDTSEDPTVLRPTTRVSDDVRREMEFHILERAAELEALGASPDEALAEARALFGNRDVIESECRTIEARRRREKHRAFRTATLRQDISSGLRQLTKSPMFTLAAVLTLCIGIGANAAVFSLVNQVILQPLDYANANRLVRITEQHEQGWGNLTWANFLDVQQQSKTFDAMASYGSWTSTVLGTATPLRVPTAPVSRDFFEVFSVRAERGRLPDASEHREGANPVAVVSHEFWRDHLGAPASLSGVTLRMDMVYDVVGVLPAGFAFPEATQIWIPLEQSRQSMSRTAHNSEVVGLVRDGVSPTAAQQEVSAILKRLQAIYADDFDAIGSQVTPLQDVLTADLKTPLYLLFAASTVLLLAACTNLASAQLARGAARAGELAIRSALGASRLRLIRQLLTESMVLSVLGAVAGLLLAYGLLKAFALSAPSTLHLERVRMDVWVMCFAFAVALLTALGFGLYPALRLSETNLTLTLREGGRGTESRRGMRVWNLLIASEIALAVMLLAGSHVLIRSFSAVMRTELGFDPVGVTTATVNLPEANYPDSGAATPTFHEKALAALRRSRGVTAAGFANRIPLAVGFPSGSLEVEGKPLNARGAFNATAIYRVVGGEYFAAMGMRMIEGRALSPQDDASAAPVVVVDAAFVEANWPGERAVGRRVRPYGMDRASEPWYTVVGVVQSARSRSVTEPYTPTYYFDHRQRPGFRTQTATYTVRSSMPTSTVTAVMRDAITSVDPQVPIETGSMSRVLANTVAVQRFMMVLLGSFAAMALMLALVGIYSVVSYAVARRTREIGVRRALGASTREVLSLVFRSAMRGVIPGLIAGGALAFLGTRALRSLVYGVSPQDPVALVSAIAVLGVVSVLSTLLPARRAARVDPLVAMRAE